MEDSKGGLRDSCFCGKTTKTPRGLRTHKKKCKTYQAEALKYGDIIKCELCDYTAAKLTQHIKKEHNLTKEFYLENYGELVSPNSKKRYSAVAKENGDWVNRAKESGKDLSEWKEKLSKGISESIMNNPEERERRSRLLGRLNKRDDFRKRASNAAKITSARPEIQKARAGQLKRWRDNNPDKFYEKCISPMHGAWDSKPERTLYKFALMLNSNFKRNRQVNSKKYFLTNKTSRKQVDIIDKKRKIIIEFDGPHHFKNIFGSLKRRQEVDRELERFCLDKKYILIRVSQSCFIYKTINDFEKKIKDKIINIIHNNKSGVYYLGKEYGSKNIMEEVK
jgi:very-short-patch-repair endonuclease